jgi:hypothetical protein
VCGPSNEQNHNFTKVLVVVVVVSRDESNNTNTKISCHLRVVKDILLWRKDVEANSVSKEAIEEVSCDP